MLAPPFQTSVAGALNNDDALVQTDCPDATGGVSRDFAERYRGLTVAVTPSIQRPPLSVRAVLKPEYSGITPGRRLPAPIAGQW